MQTFLAVEPQWHNVLEENTYFLSGYISNVDKLIDWVSINSLHITVKFLGDISLTVIKEIRDPIRNLVARTRMPVIALGNFGTFDERVIFRSIESPDLIKFQSELNELLVAEYDIRPDDFDFYPHITLGYAKKSFDVTKVLQKANFNIERAETSLPQVIMDLGLINSNQDEENPRYEPVDYFSFGF